ncbi:Aste57867_609 [Aphanomyces stellatus]|uniref:Aste57867_609 protein n=1 Tax=Aphanomyces stellatus TaxID=120398 RepID=A0A485K758_9STRA|nr:hypothetical protein As57867_000608 [Aphanomyces stellatus]VFT77834.1 Aste57867_609 [Aphanomyces stellatus]
MQWCFFYLFGNLFVFLLASTSSVQPQSVVLQLSNVRFPSHSDVYRAHLALSEKNEIPMRIWFESKQTKLQWVCVVSNFQDHSTERSMYVLPADVIVTKLKNGLSALETDSTSRCQGCEVHLTELTNKHLKLELELKPYSSMAAKYTFDLKPVTLERIDILEAQVRDLQDALESKNRDLDLMLESTREQNQAKISNVHTKLTPQELTYLYLSSTESNHFNVATWTISWNAQNEFNEAYFKLSSDAASISLLQRGIYAVQAHIKFKASNICLQIADKCVWWGHRIAGEPFLFQLSYTAFVTTETILSLGSIDDLRGRISPGDVIMTIGLVEAPLKTQAADRACSPKIACVFEHIRTIHE